MPKMGVMASQILSALLRGLTLASKFLLVFVMAKTLSLADVSVYALISAAVSYSLFLLGFDFYVYSTREMLCRDRLSWMPLVRDQFVLYLIAYVVFLPLLIFLFVWTPFVL